MKTHPLICRVARDLAKYHGEDDWESYVPDATHAIRAVAEWTEDLHKAAKADLDLTDCYITVPYLHGIVDGAYAEEHTDS